MESNEKLYTPSETARKLGVSTWTLRQMRQMGRIEGTFLGNTTLYTEEQIKNAVLPRPKKSKKTLTSTDSNEPGALAAAS
jgi:hypothetical protein